MTGNRQALSATLALLGFLLCSCVTGPRPERAEDDSAIDVSIADVKKDPWRYDGQRIRVTGTFDECQQLQCRICTDRSELLRITDEDADWPDLCLAVSFGGERDTDAVSAWYDVFARFTTSTIEGYYSAECSGVASPKQAISGSNVSNCQVDYICMDRATEIFEARIVKVHARPPATRAVLTNYGRERVFAADPVTEAALRKAFAEQRSKDDFLTSEDLSFAFVVEAAEASTGSDEIEVKGGLCGCDKAVGTCDAADWPTLFGHAWMLSLANPYFCYIAERSNGKWRFPPRP